MRYLKILTCIIIITLTQGCKKFLDEKSSASLVVPSSLADLQALLDYYPEINTRDLGYGEASADDYYISYSTWQSLADYWRDTYTWQADHLFTPSSNEWSRLYTKVYFANTVVEQINKIERTDANAPAWDNVLGQALFIRAGSYLQGAFIWVSAFDSTTAKTDLGLPLRLNSDFNQPSHRASALETYNQIISDLTKAVPLLPVTPMHPMRASRPAAYALLARTYLAMRRYHEAGLYADSCLQLKSELMDYNTLSPSATYPFPQFNQETIYYSAMYAPSLLSVTRAKIDTALYASFETNDLRRQLYFKNNSDGSHAFKGNFTGSSTPFTGIAVDEMYLIRAECGARKGKTAAALDDLNTVMEARWKAGTFVPFTAISPAQALNIILLERRKELVFRGLRWPDIKRLNKEGSSIVLTRNLNGEVFTLPPNDPRYALPIPEDIIDLTGMPQNPR